MSLFVSNPVKSLRKIKPRLQLTVRIFVSGVFILQLLSVLRCNPRNILKTARSFDWWDFRNTLWHFLKRVCLAASSHSHINKHTQQCQNLSPFPDLWITSHISHFDEWFKGLVLLKKWQPSQLQPFVSRTKDGCLIQDSGGNSYFDLWSSSSLPYLLFVVVR